MHQDDATQVPSAPDLVIASPRQEIVFILSDVGNHRQLAAELAAGREVVILDAARDGLAQIAEALQGRSGVDAVHVISHGSAGALGLGSLTLGSDAVAQRQPELAAIGASLSADADILLYGCDAGADPGLADALAIATGADVALSDDLTGHASLGGDWELEVASGNIEATPLVDAALAAAWQDVLAIPGPTTLTFDTWSNVSAAGGGTPASNDVIYRVNGNAAYALVIDGLAHATTLYQGYSRVYMGSWSYGQPESEISLSFAGGQTFNANSVQFYGDSYAYSGSPQTLQVVGYGADGQQVGSAQYVTLPGSWSTPATLNLAGLTGIQTLKIKTISDGGNLFYFAMDTLTLSDIQPLPPAVFSVGSPSPNGAYKVGDVISVTLNFDEAVTVSTSGGIPTLTLETGSTDRLATYVSGSGTSTLTFMYTVQAGDTTADLDVFSSGALALNGGTIRSAGGSDADLTLPVGTAIGSLATNKAIVVDGVAPGVVMTVDRPALKAGQTATVTLTFSEAPVGLSLADLAFSGGTLGPLSGSGLVYTTTFTPTPGVDAGAGWISMIPGGYTDAAGNPGTSAGVAISYDTLPPAAPAAPDLAAGSDSGTSGSDNITNDATPTFTGTAEAGDTVILYDTDGTTVLGSATANGSGTWSITTGALGGGTHVVTARAVDAAANFSSASAGLVVTIDASAPAAPSAPDLAAASDTGVSVTDNVTRDGTPLLTGTAEAGATVHLYGSDGSTVLAATTADGTGAWSLTPTLGAGTHTLTVRALDAAGNLGPASAALTVVVDTVAPTLAITADTATLKAGEAAVITFSFSEDPGATFTLADVGVAGGTLSGLAGTGSTRTAVFTPTANTEDGVASITVASGSYQDAAGNNGGAGTTPTLVFDTLAPAAPSAPDLAAGSDSGRSNGDNVTNDATPTFTGTAEAGATVIVYDGASVLGTTTANGSGAWSFTTGTLAQGNHTISATATDAAGNTGAASAALAVTIDTAAPGTSVPDLAAASDSGTLATDNVTSDSTPTLTGTAEAGATVVLYDTDGTTELGTTIAGIDGSWSITSSALADGTHVLATRVTDAAGNTGALSTGLAVTVDRSAPTQVADSLALSADTGWSGTDFVTNTAAQTISGTLGAPLAAGESVQVSLDGGASWTTATASGSAWTIATTLAGSGLLQVRVVDTAGNAGAVLEQPYVLDTTRPGVTLSADRAVLRSGETSTITFEFNEDPGATFTLEDIVVSGGTLGALSGTGNVRTAVFTPAAGTNNGTASISIAAGVYTDAAGNAGFPGPAPSLTFDTQAPPAPSTPALQAGSDTGASAADAVTSDATPTFTGTAEANATVTLYAGGDALGSATADGSGNWTFTAAGLADGTHQVTARAVDGFGNESPVSAPLSVTIDTGAPAVSQPVLAAASDTGASAADGITADATPTVTGTAEAGATVRLYGTDGTTLLGTATAGVDGSWSITSSALANGTHALTVRAEDAAGNVSAPSAALTVEVDTAAPVPSTTPDLAALSDTGASDSDDVTADTTPTFTGTAEAGALVTLVDATDRVLGTAVAALDGTWEITTTPLAAGTHHVNARVTDLAGNVSAATAQVRIDIDTAAPVTEIVGASLSADTGASGTDFVTNTAAQTLSGTLGSALEADETVQVSLDNGLTWSTATAAAGDTGWSHAATLTGSGTLVVRVVDGFGRAGVAWSQAYELDAAAPASPAAPVLAAASDTGASDTDGITSQRTPTVTGTAEAGATVRLYDTGGSVLLGTATADGAGNWSITSAALADGAHQLTVQATDVAGNTSAASPPLDITVDTGMPTVDGAASPTANGLYHVGDVIAIEVRFSETVVVSGQPGLALETGEVDRLATYAGGSGTDTLTFHYTVQAGDRSADLDYRGRAALRLEDGSIRDLSGNDAKLMLAFPRGPGSLSDAADLRVDGIAPTLLAARVEGAKLVLQYDEALDDSHLPALWAFKVVVDGAQVGVDGVRYNANTNSIVLQLESAATQGEAVQVTYRDAAGDQLRAIQDVAGNDAAALPGIAVRNITPNDPGSGGAITAPAGEPMAGQLLRADTSSLSDADGVRAGTLTYQWLRGGVAIEGADGASYRLGNDDIGARISLKMNYLDGAGNRETVVTEATARVADNDGVASSVEALAPALGSGIRGDGNGDGLLDAYQAEVATAVVPGMSGAERFATLVADDGRITGLATATVSGNAPADARFGDRSLVMQADVDGRGANAEFSLFVARTLDAEGLWLQDRNGQWLNATADLANGGGKTRLDFVVRDGGAYDHDGLADGHVQLVGVVGDAPTGIGGVVPGWDGGFWF